MEGGTNLILKIMGKGKAHVNQDGSSIGSKNSSAILRLLLRSMPTNYGNIDADRTEGSCRSDRRCCCGDRQRSRLLECHGLLDPANRVNSKCHLLVPAYYPIYVSNRNVPQCSVRCIIPSPMIIRKAPNDHRLKLFFVAPSQLQPQP